LKQLCSLFGPQNQTETSFLFEKLFLRLEHLQNPCQSTELSNPEASKIHKCIQNIPANYVSISSIHKIQNHTQHTQTINKLTIHSKLFTKIPSKNSQIKSNFPQLTNQNPIKLLKVISNPMTKFIQLNLIFTKLVMCCICDPLQK
jgi:hypothetical protein